MARLETLEVTVRNSWCFVHPESPRRMKQWLHKLLSVEIENIVMGEYQSYQRRLYNMKHNRFPAGMLGLVYEMAQKNNIPITMIDETQNRASFTELSEHFSYLNDHQLESLEAMKKHRNGIIKQPTGAGKSESVVAFASCFTGNILFIADENTLLEDVSDRYRKHIGKDVGSIHDPKQFTVASFDAIRYHRKSLEVKAYLQSDVDCIICDEVHVAAAKTRWATVMSIPAYRRYGLSATPYDRSDGMNPYVCAAFGPIIHEISTHDVQGIRTVPATIVFYAYPFERDEMCDSWQSVIKHFKPRMKATVQLCRVAPKPLLVFFEWKAHGYDLQKILKYLGMNCEIVHGDHSTKHRKKMIEDLNEVETEILLASRIFTKGVDIPNLRSCLNIAGMKATIPLLQKHGRGVRKVEGKDSFMFYDLYDRVNSTNRKHSKKRFETYQKEGLNVQVCDDIETIKRVTEESLNQPKESVSDPTEIIGDNFLQPMDARFIRDSFSQRPPSLKLWGEQD